MTAPLVALCFFLSGAAGLVYQVVWLRMLSLVLGHTVLAVTAVLTAFMAGLALGGWLFSRWAGATRRPLAVYGAVEIATGLWCALLPWLFPVASTAVRALALPGGPEALAEFALLAGLLLVPTTLLGGTLPLLAQWLAEPGATAGAKTEPGADRGGAGAPLHAGRRVGTLYALNTAGAVLGAGGAGYVLLPALGNRRTLLLASMASVAIGIACVASSRRRHLAIDPGPSSRAEARDGSATGEAPAVAPTPGASSIPPLGILSAPLAFVAVAVSGAIAMVYEVAWTRALSLVLGSSTYAFSAMLTACLAGIAGGSALYAWLLGRRRAALATLGLLQLGAAAATAAVICVFDRLPGLLLAGLRWSDSPASVQAVQLGISVLAVLPAALFLGATFPCAAAVVFRAAVGVGRDAGELYALNTLGAVLGAAVAGLSSIPVVGVQTTLALGAAAGFALAAVLLAMPPGRRPRSASGAGAVPAARSPSRAPRAAASVIALAAAVSTVFLPRWDDRTMASGPAIYARAMLAAAPGSALEARLARPDVIFRRDGATATVVVTADGPDRALRINGKIEASTGRDMHTQLMMGHLPMLLHPSPRAVLIAGLGSGVTAAAVARHPVERIAVAEIEPAVVEAAALFEGVNRGVLADPRLAIAVTDARRLLDARAERYDVIVSQPSNPWIGGMAALFTAEFFSLARRRLAPGGIMVQWVQLYGLGPDDLRMVIATFRSAFPATSVWHTSSGDLILLGRVAAEPIDTTGLRARYPRAAEDLARLGARGWPAVLGYALLDEDDTARLAAGAAINGDDRLPLEFSAPRSLHRDTGSGNRALLRAHRRGDLPHLTAEGRREVDTVEARVAIGRAALARGASPEALPHFARAHALDPRDRAAALGLCTTLLNLDRTAEGWALAERLVGERPDDGEALFLAGLAAGRLGRRSAAVALLERAVASDPDAEAPRVALANARRRAQLDR